MPKMGPVIVRLSCEASPWVTREGHGRLIAAVNEQANKGREKNSYLFTPFHAGALKREPMTRKAGNFALKIGDANLLMQICNVIGKSGLIPGMHALRNPLFRVESGEHASFEDKFSWIEIMKARIFAAIIPAMPLLGIKPDAIFAYDPFSALSFVFLLEGIANSRNLHEHFRKTKLIYVLQSLKNPLYNQEDFFSVSGLNPRLFTPSALELCGKISLLKAGLVFSDLVLYPHSQHQLYLTQDQYGQEIDRIVQDLHKKIKIRPIMDATSQSDQNGELAGKYVKKWLAGEMRALRHLRHEEKGKG